MASSPFHSLDTEQWRRGRRAELRATGTGRVLIPGAVACGAAASVIGEVACRQALAMCGSQQLTFDASLRETEAWTSTSSADTSGAPSRIINRGMTPMGRVVSALVAQAWAAGGSRMRSRTIRPTRSCDASLIGGFCANPRA